MNRRKWCITGISVGILLALCPLVSMLGGFLYLAQVSTNLWNQTTASYPAPLDTMRLLAILQLTALAVCPIGLALLVASILCLWRKPAPRPQ